MEDDFALTRTEFVRVLKEWNEPQNLPDVHHGDWVRLRKDAPANIAGGAGFLMVEENRPGWARLYHSERTETPSVTTYSEVPAPGPMLSGYVAEVWRLQNGDWVRLYLAPGEEAERG